MNANSKKNNRPGVALLIVLFVIMAITVLSVGFLSRSDVELACGQNMIVRIQMDYLAESGLEHARGLILNPQDISSEYWAGATAQQLVEGSNDYYDVEVIRDDSEPEDRCNYLISCNSYRLEGGEKIGRSSMAAKLRLDPCIAFWAGTSAVISQRITINGDVYCNGNMSGNGYVGGDVFASGSITGTNITGQKNEAVVAPVNWPELDISDFNLNYFIGSESYSVEIIDPNISNIILGPSDNNPAGIYYCEDPNYHVTIEGDVTVNGTLVVNGDLEISGTNNVITAMKNFPALLVKGKVIIEDGGTVHIKGLAQIGQAIEVSAGAHNMDIEGGLFVASGTIEGAASSSISINIIADPLKASLQTWPSVDIAKRWRPVTGGFFRSIERK